jgi:tetratricopeptide (TPR) repeat protein
MDDGATRTILEALGVFLMLHSFALKRILVSLARMGHRRMLTRATAAACWLLDVLYFNDRGARLFAAFCRAYAAADAGRSQPAARSIERALVLARGRSPSVCDWNTVNAATDIYVNAGRYRHAVAAAERWPAEAQQAGREASPASFALARINMAEALHNLGRNDEALAVLAETEPLVQEDPVGCHGLRLLRAWILAHHGRAAEAREEIARVDSVPLTPRYTAEVFYTRSVIARELGALDEAEREAREGLACARRAASRRNGHYVLGAVLLARGNVEAALAALETFAASRYRGQAACGLVLLAAARERAGDVAGAARAQALAIERDPESWLSTRSKAALSGTAPR